MERPNNLNDDMVISLNIKWLVQIVFFIVSITAGYFTLKGSITNNTKDVSIIKSTLVEYEEEVDDRISRLEDARDLQLEQVNRSLMDKVLGKGD